MYCKLRITNFTLQISSRKLAKVIYKLNIAHCKFRIAKCPLEFEFAKKMTPPKFQPKSLIQTNWFKMLRMKKSHCSSNVICDTFAKIFPNSFIILISFQNVKAFILSNSIHFFLGILYNVHASLVTHPILWYCLIARMNIFMQIEWPYLIMKAYLVLHCMQKLV